MSTPQEFKISVPNDDLALLKRKLELNRFLDELDGAEWKFGIPLADMQRLVTYWKDGYEWRKHEKALNDELPQFTVDVDVEGFESLNIHLIHMHKGKTTDAIPLLIVHGWLGSLLEFRKLLLLLSSAPPGSLSSDVVALSLPGFGFSQGSKKQGFGLDQYCDVRGLL